MITRVSENDWHLYVGETVREGKHNQAPDVDAEKLKYRQEMVCGSRHTTWGSWTVGVSCGGLRPSWEIGDEFGNETAVRNPEKKRQAPVGPAELERKSNGYVWKSVRNHGPWWRWDASLRTSTRDWRVGAVGENNWSLSMRCWVWMSCTHIKSQAWLHTLELWGGGVLTPESLLHNQNKQTNKWKTASF